MKKKILIALLFLLTITTVSAAVPLVTFTDPVQCHDDDSKFTLSNKQIKIEIYKGSAGYNKMYDAQGNIIVYHASVKLQYFKESSESWNQRGTPQTTTLDVNTGTECSVIRSYTDYIGTDYNVIFTLSSFEELKIAYEYLGQADQYRWNHSFDGVAGDNNYNMPHGKRFGSTYEDWVFQYDWTDLYNEGWGDMNAEFSTTANGKKMDLYLHWDAEADTPYSFDPKLASDLYSTPIDYKPCVVSVSDQTLFAIAATVDKSVFVTKSTDAGATFTNIDVNLFDLASAPQQPEILWDSVNNKLVIFVLSANDLNFTEVDLDSSTGLVIADYSGNSWGLSDSNVVAPNAYACDFNSQGWLICIWAEGAASASSVLMYGFANGSNTLDDNTHWVTGEILEATYISAVNLKIKTNGNWHASYSTGAGEATIVNYLNYSVDTGFSTPLNLEALDPDIVFSIGLIDMPDPDTNISILVKGGGKLFHLNCDDEISCDTIENWDYNSGFSGGTSWNGGIASDGDGNIHILYGAINTDINMVRKDPYGIWGSPKTLHSEGGDKVSVSQTSANYGRQDYLHFDGTTLWFNTFPVTVKTAPSPNLAPDTNVIYPNTEHLQFSGSKNIDFNAYDIDYNGQTPTLDVNIYIRSLVTAGITAVITDLNLLATGICDDTNFQEIQKCSYLHNFSDLNVNEIYVVDINITDSGGLTTNKSADYNFTIVKTTGDLNIFSKVEFLDLTEDGVYAGEASEAWLQGESKNKEINTINVDRDQIFILKALNDNASLTIYINYVEIGTKDANAADPKIWQWYLFDVADNYLVANPQFITIEAGGSQNTTYIDYIGFMDIQDINMIEGGDAVAGIWDVNGGTGVPLLYNRLGLDQDGTVTFVDANTVDTSYGKFFAMFETTQSLDKNIIAWPQADANGNIWVPDENKEMIVDSTDPVINTITMELDTQIGKTYTFDSNCTDLYMSHAKLEIEEVDYDLNIFSISANDYNFNGEFSFAGTGDYSAVLKIYDDVDQNITYPFTIHSSSVTMTIGAADQNSVWTRTTAKVVSSTSEDNNSDYHLEVSFTYAGTANIDYNTYYVNVQDGNSETIKLMLWLASGDSNNTLTTGDSPAIFISAYDLDDDGSHTETISYTVEGNIRTQYANTGPDDKRLVRVQSFDHNTALTDYWVKVSLRTPYDASAYHMTFKDCETGVNWTAQTCTSWVAHDIYDDVESTYNGGIYPTEDTDSDGYVDTIYFKVPTLSEHMFELDLAAGAETEWTEPSGGGSSSGGSGKKNGEEEEEIDGGIIEPSGWWEGIVYFFSNLWDGFGGGVGEVGEFFGLQLQRLGYIDWTSESIFYLISLGIIASIIIFFIPRAEKKAKGRKFAI